MSMLVLGKLKNLDKGQLLLTGGFPGDLAISLQMLPHLILSSTPKIRWNSQKAMEEFIQLSTLVHYPPTPAATTDNLGPNQVNSHLEHGLKNTVEAKRACSDYLRSSTGSVRSVARTGSPRIKAYTPGYSINNINTNQKTKRSLPSPILQTRWQHLLLKFLRRI